MSNALDSDSHDPFMLELFHVELENNSRILESGLIQAEKDQSPGKMEPLMRAAHSIKGAARIVNLPSAVALAHVMEDILSASQNGKLTLSAAHVDALLQANDLFLSLSQNEPGAIPGWLMKRTTEIEAVINFLSNLSTGEMPASPKVHEKQPSMISEPEPSIVATDAPPVQAAIPSIPRLSTPAETKQPPSGSDDELPAGAPAFHIEPPRTTSPDKTDSLQVRVMAENLNRLMGLAGECLVQAQSTKPFYAALLKIKTISMALQSTLDQKKTERAGSISSQQMAGIDISVFAEQLQELASRQAMEFEIFSRRLEHLAHRLYGEVIASRMVPFSDGLHGYSRMIRDVAKELGKKVDFLVQGDATPVDRDILEKLEAPLSHLLRNAIDHGLEMPGERVSVGKSDEGKLILEARHAGGQLHIIVSDDGRGIDPEMLRQKIVERGYATGEMAAALSRQELLEFLFLPGFSTASTVTEISGRGVGLDVVYAAAQEVGGSVRIDSEPGAGSRFHLQLPLTLSILKTLLVEIHGEPYALPLNRIDRVLEIAPGEIQVIEDRQFCSLDGEFVGIVDAHQLFHIPALEKQENRWHIVVISDRLNRYGLVIDRFLGERDLVVRPLDARLGKIIGISAGAVLQDGSPVLIFDVDDLVRSIDHLLKQGRLNKIGLRQEGRAEAVKRILVVDDSLTVREVERKLLNSHGYHVTVAVDGVDGWNTLQSDGKVDLVISDIDMPRMNGIEMVRKIKSDPQFKDLPVMIVSYKDREDDRLRGLEAGANYYLTKSSFHDERLLGAVRDLIGEP